MDKDRFTATIASLREKLYRRALKILADEAEAEDNVQETLLRLWTMREEMNKYANPAGLAMTINKNLCLDKLRKRKNSLPVDYLENHCPEQTPQAGLERKETVDTVKRIIYSLPPVQQMIILMRDVEGYEIAEIAEIMASRPETVRVTLGRARQNVRDKYFKITGK